MPHPQQEDLQCSFHLRGQLNFRAHDLGDGHMSVQFGNPPAKLSIIGTPEDIARTSAALKECVRIVVEARERK
jgi:hypothetical protein